MDDSSPGHAGDLHLCERGRSHGCHQGDLDETSGGLQKGRDHHDNYNQAVRRIQFQEFRAPAEETPWALFVFKVGVALVRR